MAQQLRAVLFLQRSHVWFPTLTPDSSQLPIISATEETTTTSYTPTCTDPQRDTKIYTQLKIKIKLQ